MRPTSFSRRTLLAALAAAGLAAGAPAAAQEPVRIGELNSYNRQAAFTVPYRNGWQMAMDEVNEAGGVLGGRPLEIISRDDGGTTGDAVRIAEELVSREGVSFIFGTFLSNVGLAVGDFANQRRVLFLAAEPLTDAMTMEAGNPYTFRVRPSTYMQTRMLVDAIADRDIDRWAIVAPNYEYGQSAAENFKALIAEANPDAEIVVEQYPALGQIDAGSTVSAVERAQPDGIFNVTFGGDLAQFVREGNTRGLFEDRTVISLISGEPEWLLPLGEETPEGWIVTGYPWAEIDIPAHRDFVERYVERFGDTPRLGSLLGYICVTMIRDMIEAAGSAETEDLMAALEDMEFDTIAGPVTMRGIDNQATLGAWVGTLGLRDGEGVMTDWYYADGADYLFSEEEVRAARGD